MLQCETKKMEYSETKTSKIALITKDIFEALLVAFIAIFLLFTIGFKICTVNGGSMNNTLNHGDNLIILNCFYTPKENDIIVFHDTKSLNEPLVKRVIATGDKWVRIDYDNAIVYVSEDDVFDENDIIDESQYVYFDRGHYSSHGIYEVFVPKGFIFVMGDNRNNSIDSRSQQIGLVDEKTILGKVIFRIAPIDKMGIVQ